MDTLRLSADDLVKLYSRNEGHFLDFKSKEIQPGKLTRSVSAFANADGGEIFVGIEEPSSGGPKTWNGLDRPESANAFIQMVEQVCPLGEGVRLSFLEAEGQPGLVLFIEVMKSRSIVKANNDEIYVRRGAQNLPISTPEGIDRLELNKGISSFESRTIDADEEVVSNSLGIIEFMLEVVPHQDPEKWPIPDLKDTELRCFNQTGGSRWAREEYSARSSRSRRSVWSENGV